MIPERSNPIHPCRILGCHFQRILFQMEELRSGVNAEFENTKTNSKNCFQDNYQNIAASATTRYAENPEACQKMLNGQTRCSGCNFWTYQKSKKRCSFKFNQTLGPFDSDWISGPKNC